MINIHLEYSQMWIWLLNQNHIKLAESDKTSQKQEMIGIIIMTGMCVFFVVDFYCKITKHVIKYQKRGHLFSEIKITSHDINFQWMFNLKVFL